MAGIAEEIPKEKQDNEALEEEEVVDEYQVAFDAVVEGFDSGILLSGPATISFKELLNSNDRTDDAALKIKEQCLYRYANCPAVNFF
jgi:hypothetical protein